MAVSEDVTSQDVENLLRRSLNDQYLSVNGVRMSCSGLGLLATLAGAHILLVEAHVCDSDVRHESLPRARVVLSRGIKIDLNDPAI